MSQTEITKTNTLEIIWFWVKSNQLLWGTKYRDKVLHSNRVIIVLKLELNRLSNPNLSKEYMKTGFWIQVKNTELRQTSSELTKIILLVSQHREKTEMILHIVCACQCPLVVSFSCDKLSGYYWITDTKDSLLTATWLLVTFTVKVTQSHIWAWGDDRSEVQDLQCYFWLLNNHFNAFQGM